MTDLTPTPVPSEVAETTAGEREVEGDRWTCGGCGQEGNGPDNVEWTEHTKVCPDLHPAEPDAGEVESLFDCSCGHSIDEHNGLGCYSRLSYAPLVTCECPLTDDRTHGELLAPRLAALLDRVRREEGAKVLREAADTIVLPGSESGGFYAGEVDAGYREAERHAEDWLLARAASVGRGEGL